jgi:hypothetical protein
MTEQEWQAGYDSWVMADWLIRSRKTLANQPSDRKLRLFACACARHGWYRLGYEQSRQAVVVAERYADELEDGAGLLDAAVEAFRAHDGYTDSPELAAAECCNPIAAHAASNASDLPIAAKEKKAAILRDTIGSPNRKVLLPPAQRSENAQRLAQSAYEGRDPKTGLLDPFILCLVADALEEAGCDHVPLLRSLRGYTPCVHDASPCDDCGGTGWKRATVGRYRGFWPLDLVLGKG